jgi:hypothetical protein
MAFFRAYLVTILKTFAKSNADRRKKPSKDFKKK